MEEQLKEFVDVGLLSSFTNSSLLSTCTFYLAVEGHNENLLLSNLNLTPLTLKYIWRRQPVCLLTEYLLKFLSPICILGQIGICVTWQLRNKIFAWNFWRENLLKALLVWKGRTEICGCSFGKSIGIDNLRHFSCKSELVVVCHQFLLVYSCAVEE